jgi:peptide/nickel transport system permease protein
MTGLKLIAFVAQRIALFVPALLFVVTLTFVVSRLLSGDPAVLMAGPIPDPKRVEAIRAEFGLDKSIPTQYAIYLAALARGDLGVAWHTGNSVSDDLQARFPATLELVVLALAMAIVVGVPLGVWAAIGKNSIPDHLARILNLLGTSVPSFWLGLILIYFLFFKFHVFPAPIGRLPVGTEPPHHTSGMYLLDSLLVADFSTFWSALKQIALPTLTLSFATMAPITRMVRNSMVEVLQSDYIRAARAFGVPNLYIYFVYGLRNATLPLLTLIAILFGNLVAGAVLVEHVFAWQGIGFWAADAALKSDYAAVQGFVILTAAVYMLVFLVVDVLYWVVDPRTREA